MKFNVNDYVTVTLNEGGCRVYKEYWEESDITPPRNFQPGDKLKDQLWHVMAIFGPHITLTVDPPFSTEIEIHVEKDNG